MGLMKLRLEKRNLGPDLGLGVVTRVQQIKDAQGNFPVEPVDREMVIPVGLHSFRAEQVPAGTYRIEARLPSGEALRQTMEVGEEPEGVEVVLEPEHSPRDWLSWQRLAGNVPSPEQYEAWIGNLAQQLSQSMADKTGARTIEIDKGTIKQIATVTRGLHVKALPTLRALGNVAKSLGAESLGTRVGDWAEKVKESARGAEPSAPPAEFELVQSNPADGERLWEAVSSFESWNAWRKTARSHAGCSFERKDDGGLTLWRITQVDRVGCTVETVPGKRVPLRCIALLQRGTGVDMITLPVPWPLTPNMPPAELEILREAGTALVGRNRVTVRDDLVGVLLVYLDNRRLAEASALLATGTGSVEQLIYEKQQNPLAACAAAYVGIATMSAVAEPRWAPWLENVKNWFDWVPDGAIVHAAYKCKTAQSRNDLDAALDSFKEGYRRGIPFYVAGVQHLMNGLDTFRAKDAEAEWMYQRVSKVAANIDPDQAFTVITIPHPS